MTCVIPAVAVLTLNVDQQIIGVPRNVCIGIGAAVGILEIDSC